MISLISAALIIVFPLDACLGASESIAHAVELRVEAAVQDRAADLGHEAAEQMRVDGLLDDELLAQQHPREPGAEALALRVGQRDGRAQLHPRLTLRFVVERTIRGRDGGEMI